MNVVCLYFPASLPLDALRSLAEACLRLSSQVALRKDEAVFIETGGSRLLYGEDSLRARLLALGLRFQAAASIPPHGHGRGARPGSGRAADRVWLGWGAHAGEALARARYGRSGQALQAWPLEALECYAAPFFHDEEVGQRMRAMAAALRSLGIADLGAFLDLPAAGWGERFGPDAAVLRERLEGRMIVGWPRFEPAQRLAEGQDLRDVETQSVGVDDGALRFHLKNLCDRVAARLRGRALRAAGLALELRFERTRGRVDAAPWILAVPLAMPLAEPSQLRKLLQERLEAEARGRPLPRPLESLRLTVTSTAPGFSPQRDAFDRREEEQEARHGLLARLSQRLGEGRVFYAQVQRRHSPERAWRPGPQAQAPREGDVQPAPRPTRLLRRPLLLARTGDWLLYWGGSGKARRWRAVDWRGPERIGGEWWLGAGLGLDAGLGAGSGVELGVGTGLKTGAGAVADGDIPQGRDYWRVGTAAGQDLWLFCRQGEEARSGALWLQGWWA
jgi:hypothetical protein